LAKVSGGLSPLKALSIAIFYFFISI